MSANNVCSHATIHIFITDFRFSRLILFLGCYSVWLRAILLTFQRSCCLYLQHVRLSKTSEAWFNNHRTPPPPWFYSHLKLGRFFQFLNLYTVDRTPWTGTEPVARPLRAHRTTQAQNKRTQTSMLRVGFEPTIPVFEQAKTFLRQRDHCHRLSIH
jgi:hypothetical protein